METPMANRLHIAIFGRRNVGKSSLINALTNQNLALVSRVAGTTTDPVYKMMELLPLGPIVLIDTAGIDDTGELGEMRVQKTLQILHKTDLAILIFDPAVGVTGYELGLIGKILEHKITLIGIVNKIDQYPSIDISSLEAKAGIKLLPVSAITQTGISVLKDALIKAAPTTDSELPILGDLVDPGDTVILVVPIDSAAPKGRLILPQVQTLRDLLDHSACGLVTRETELVRILQNIHAKPRMVVTDSQIFGVVSPLVPKDIPLTGFSVLFARQKGDLSIYTRGVKAMANLQAGDKVLIAEACTHHRQQDDIGTVKIPKWLEKYVGGKLQFDHTAGQDFSPNLDEYKLVVHCGGCMATRREILHRLKTVDNLHIPIVNYGMLIAYLHGILDRALEPFPEALAFWKE